jgi:hypothetical protein
VEQDESVPIVRVEENGTVHPLREGRAVVGGEFDSVIDRIQVTVYSKDERQKATANESLPLSEPVRKH